MVDLLQDLNIEIVGSAPEDVIFDSVPQSHLIESLTSVRYKSNLLREDQEPW